jgi:hypothetical protein
VEREVIDKKELKEVELRSEELQEVMGKIPSWILRRGISVLFAEKTNDFRSQIRSMTSQLKANIHSWEMSYVLISPIDGKITFTRYWVSNQVGFSVLIFDK